MVHNWSDVVAPNGLAFSGRERAGESLPKTNDLARAAVCCNAGLDGISREGTNVFIILVGLSG